MSDTCHYCGSTDRELRPYGPGGAMVCHPCATAAPEREATAEGAFWALLDAAGAISPLGAAVVGQESGPQPYVEQRCPVTELIAEQCAHCRSAPGVPNLFDVPAQCSCPGDGDGGHSWNCRYAGVPEEIEREAAGKRDAIRDLFDTPDLRGPWFSAAYGGLCTGCGWEIEQGDRIRSDGEGGWLCEGCGSA